MGRGSFKELILSDGISPECIQFSFWISNSVFKRDEKFFNFSFVGPGTKTTFNTFLFMIHKSDFTRLTILVLILNNWWWDQCLIGRDNCPQWWHLWILQDHFLWRWIFSNPFWGWFHWWGWRWCWWCLWWWLPSRLLISFQLK